MIGTVLTAPDRLRLSVRVQPRASRSRLVGLHGEALKVQLTAPPVDGAANAALVDLLADVLGVPRTAVRIVAGEHARQKVVEVAAPDPAVLGQRIAHALSR